MNRKSSRGPTKQEVLEAADKRVPDRIKFGLSVLFVGINPSLYSAAVGHHFARPGNRFWPTLHGAKWTPRQFRPDEDARLMEHGCGITNLVSRATTRADELSHSELSWGAKRLNAKIEIWKPRCVAFAGITSFREAFKKPTATMGRQDEETAGALTWVLPNPSGLNAHYQLPALVKQYRLLREALQIPPA